MSKTFIQWKGTDVCMDVYCKCGHHFHLDGMFCYYTICPKCKTKYKCEPEIQLTEVEVVDGPVLEEVKDEQ
jgi:hypothetical protein